MDARFICSACGADRGCNRNKVTHHDALEFPDGTLVKLTRLTPGQKAIVRQLPAAPKTAIEAKARERLEVVAQASGERRARDPDRSIDSWVAPFESRLLAQLDLHETPKLPVCGVGLGAVGADTPVAFPFYRASATEKFATLSQPGTVRSSGSWRHNGHRGNR